MVCNVLFKNERVNAVNRDERAFVKHGRMQDLLRGAQLFWGLGKLHAGKAARGVTTLLLGRFWGMPSPQLPKNIFKWCNLVRFGVYFHNIFT